MAQGAQAASRGWPSSTLSATRLLVRQKLFWEQKHQLSHGLVWYAISYHNHWFIFLPCYQLTVGEVLQFLLERLTALITSTGTQLSPASRRKRICCAVSEMDTNTMISPPSLNSLVSIFELTFIISVWFFCSAAIFLLVGSGSEVSGNWEAVDAKSPQPDSRYFLNVCHKVLQTGDAVGCPVNASICAMGRSFYKLEFLKNGVK